MALITKKNKRRHRIQFTMSCGLHERYTSYQILAKNLGLAVNLSEVFEEWFNIQMDKIGHELNMIGTGGGQTWSQSFSAASKMELGFSNGAHGLRHSYAQNRMKELQLSGMRYDEARRTVAQEVGHFDKKTTEAYLR